MELVKESMVKFGGWVYRVVGETKHLVEYLGQPSFLGRFALEEVGARCVPLYLFG